MRRPTRLSDLGVAFLCLTLSASVAPGQTAKLATPPAGPSGFEGRYIICAASPGGYAARVTGPQYFSAPFSGAIVGGTVYWQTAFAAWLNQKYGYKGVASCLAPPTLAAAQAQLQKWVDDARRIPTMKYFETGWVYDPSWQPGAPSAATPAPAASSGQTPATPNATDQGTTMRAMCSSHANGPVVYFSQVFDTRLGRPDKGVDIFAPIANEFHQYLKGRYDYTTSANGPTGCGGFLSLAQIAKARSDGMASVGAGNRVLELEWSWSPDTAEAPRGVRPAFDHGYCASSGATGTVYTAGPLDVKGRVSTHDWNRGFTQFLASKYGFQGAAECAIGMPRSRALRLFSFHVQGARAANRKVVETGWELGAAAAPSSQAAQPNAPNEARPAAPAATPSQEARAFATKEAPEVLTYCQNDRALYRGLDCDKVQRLVYNYRIDHAADGTPEPLATLLNDKLDCSSCVDNMRTPAWAKQQAHGSGNIPAVSECVGQRIMAAFLARPYVSQLKAAYDATLATCKR